ncbi:MAG: hypothetical protein V4648_05735 [Bacteroidota bacterium]
MDTDKIIELAFYTLPALITGGVAYYLFNSYFNDQQNTRRWLVQKENQKLGLPLRLQAYERLVLFLERISPNKLLIRVAPLSEDKMDYVNLLIHHIDQEFDHNLTQQIYVSDECWLMILTAKNTVIQNLRKTAIGVDVTNADELRQTLLSNQFEFESSTTIALSYLKSEVTSFL